MIAPARRAAWRTLRAIHTNGTDLATALENERGRLDDSRDRALVSELVFGVCRWRAALDAAIGWAGRRDIDAFDATVLDILRLGAYQLLHLDRVPAAAAVDDAVNLCRAEGARRATTIVNAILRTISRERGRIPLPSEDDPLGFLSVTLSHPAWLAERWLARLGPDRAATWARFNNDPAGVTLRANPWLGGREDLAEALRVCGIDVEPTTYAPHGLQVRAGLSLAAASPLSARFSVQDESSQLVAAFVGARPGERVLDTCAAPGGKTLGLIGDAEPTGFVVACDLRPRRVRLLSQTLRRAAAPASATVRADATHPLPFQPVFDAVLVDAPCSGLGTLRRDPDIRWRRQPGDLAEFASVQGRILHAAAAMVRTGGRLVYATCSSEPDENQAVVAQFCASHAGWHPEPRESLQTRLPASVLPCLDEQGFLAPTPDQHGLEPFFAVSLIHTPKSS